MCGIAGIWNRNASVADGEEVMSRMTGRLRHRGPDDAGIWSDPQHSLYFGHRRLSIIDLSPAGHQPMVSPSGTVIVFNGEIFNYLELKEKYFRNATLSSSSDTEILLLLYEKLGSGCLKELNGMFAMAIWDPKKEELFIARDRLGKKPVYYSFVNGLFVFASEIKAILEAPGFRKKLDESALYDFLTFNLLAPPATMFDGVCKLPPGTCLTLRRSGDPVIERFWKPHYTDLSSMDEQALKDETLRLLGSSVAYRTISDVPVGAFLSGGVDSSAIVAFMSSQSNRGVKTYSIGFEGQEDYDERRFAETIARRFHTDHHEKVVHPHEIADFLPVVVDHFDEPMADATCIPIHFLSEKARQNGTIVVLTGDGGDELFAGYRNWMRYSRLYPAFTAYSKAPAFFKRMVAATYRNFGKSEVRIEMLERAAAGQEFFWGGAKSYKESMKRKVLSDAFNRSTAGLNSYHVIDEFRKQFLSDFTLNRKDPVDWMCYLGTAFNIPNYYLHRMDRLGMASSIEIRTPFLDYRLVEFALSLDPTYKVRNGEPKYLLKKALEGHLSKDILYRKKRGFNVPLKEWAGPVMTDYIDSNLRAFCNDFPQFRYEGLKQQLDRLKKGEGDVTNRLWTIYFLMNWFRRWMT